MTGDRIVIAAGLLAVTALAWAWIAPMAVDMYGPMTGPSAWMMTTDWDAERLVLLWAMWAVMMAAMMLPSALPMVLLYAQAEHGRGTAARVVSRAWLIATGYLVVWALFSVAATALQRLLSRWLLLTPMMEMVQPAASASVLLLAGLYQFTPLKRLCLESCRSPLSFVMQTRRSGAPGAMRMGVEHGVYCLGCCWALMLLLFVGGVMNLWVIVALTFVVLVEKLLPGGERISGVIGSALIALAVWMWLG
jgi:predicted metal-binding membrane protein